MRNHFFVSYSKVDGGDFIKKLSQELKSAEQVFPLWIDTMELKPGIDWDEQIDDAIKLSKAILFVITEDSVRPNSVCKQEWDRGLKFKKPIIPLVVQKDVDVPFRLALREYISFLQDFDSAIERLKTHLIWLDSKEGVLYALKTRLADAERALPREPDKKDRILDDIRELRLQIEMQEELISHPVLAENRVQANIEAGMQFMKGPGNDTPASGKKRFINAPPMVAPSWFQNRHVETGLVGGFLKDESLRIMTICGRGGIGKTAMVSRLLRALETGQLPDDGGALEVSGIVYLSDARSTNRVNYPDLYESLKKLLPEQVAQKLETLYKNPSISAAETMEALLASFPPERIIVLLDNFEDEVDNETGEIKNQELSDALSAILQSPPHPVKVIITTRISPTSLALNKPNLQQRIDLETGLESPFAENVLRAMDVTGKLGLKNAPANLLKEARERTSGHPRALEYLFGILSADRDTSLEEILENTSKLLPDQVVNVLVGEAFSRLDAKSQLVMQAIAVYRYPVSAGAVDYLLQSFIDGINSKTMLSRLVNMQFVRSNKGLYFLHQIDREYAFNLIPKGTVADRYEASIPFTRYALLDKAAEWFRQVQKPVTECKNLQDIAAYLSEYELRVEGEDYESAAYVLAQVDYQCLTWGHFKLCSALHLRLQGKLTEPVLVENAAGTLGIAYLRMGEHKKSVESLTTALDMAKQRNDNLAAGTWVTNLGGAYGEYGYIDESIYYCQEAVGISRANGDKGSEAVAFSNLGWWYSQVGPIEKAIEYYKTAIGIYEQTGNLENACVSEADLGDSYAKVLDYTLAEEHLNKARTLSRENNFRFPEILSLNFSGKAFAAQGLLKEGLPLLMSAIEAADECAILQFQKEARHGAALIKIFSKDYSGAIEMLEEAEKYHYPLCNHETSLLLGLATLLNNEQLLSIKYFNKALELADEVIEKSPRFFNAFDMKTIAYAGLTLLGKQGLITKAIEDWNTARSINNDKGIVRRVQQLFESISAVDDQHVLEKLRGLIEGSEVYSGAG